MLPNRIHIVGASGSGTTSLAAALSARHGHRHLDTDDFYWLPTDPPYREKRPVPERLSLLRAAMAESPSWVLSGSLCSWGNPLIPEFDLVVFVLVPHEVRMARLVAREIQRYGENAIAPGGAMHEGFAAFLDWASRYDTGGTEVRSRAVHEAWLATLPCATLRLEGDRPIAEQLALVERASARRAGESLREIASSFDARASSYARGDWHRSCAERLVAACQLQPGSRVLDAATGTGFAALAAAEAVGAAGSVLGVDISPGMLREANAAVARTGLRNVEFALGDAARLPLHEDGTFDAITCAAGLLYMPVDEALREWHRLLKGDGLVAFTSMRAGSPAAGRIFRECAATFGVSLQDPSEPLGSDSACRHALETAGFAVVSIFTESVEFSPQDRAHAWEANFRSAAHSAVLELGSDQQEELKAMFLEALAREEAANPAALSHAEILHAVGRRVRRIKSVIVVDHDPDWPRVFESLRAPLWEAVADIAISIEHVGSTAVPGLAAKPVIDIDVVVPEGAVAAGIARLTSLGYEHRGDRGVPTREAFRAPAGLPPHHLYLCPSTSPALANHLAVRDHLRANPAIAREYGELKRRLAAEFANDIDGYIEGKTSFLVGMLRQLGFAEHALSEITRINRLPEASTGPDRIECFLIEATSSEFWDDGAHSGLETERDFHEAAGRRDGTGRTLLHVAAKAGDVRALRGLLDAGADVNAADLMGETPLIYAARAGALEAARLLLAAGANVRAHHLEGWTALAAAVIHEHEAIVELLLTREQNLDPAILRPGMTPVRMAVQINHVGILRRLLRAGARHDLRGFDGQTPLELARSLERVECEQALLEAGAR